jgi:hypothetical protein
VLRQATLVLVAATALTPVAAAGRHGHPPQASPQRVVVRTELVRAGDGFDWLDAAAGFGLAMASGAVVLLLVAGHRNGGLKASDRKDT